MTALMLVMPIYVQAQVVIGGSIYGGGNHGDTDGNTTVTVNGGDISGSVFGGARSAAVGGRTFVNIDGAHATDDIIINAIYGGNDVSGTVGTSTYLPQELTDTTTNLIDNTYNAFIRTSKEAENCHIYVGRLFGGGNHASLGKAYLELCGGTFGEVYGGGNEATVDDQTDIFLDNASEITPVAGEDAEGNPTGIAALTEERIASMGLNLTTFSNSHQFMHVFGGNNKAEMDINPTWHLTRGSVHDLYSGGNEGDMTAPDGITLTVASDDMEVLNVYGGCRKADVAPTNVVHYGATVTIMGGKITNVYGGNDIAGNVAHGTNVDIQSSIIGDVYGGGNGSYVYTDNEALQGDARYGDFYYDKGDKSSAEALLDYRPNVEKVLIHLAGTDAEHPTYIGGAVYCGGNSATLRTSDGSLADARASIQIGSHVIADKVFLGSNGANLIDGDILQTYAGSYNEEKISTMNLTATADFEKYMQGVEVAIRPSVSFDDDYEAYSSKVGSFYCGGNVGSMTAAGTFTVDFLNSLIIYTKLVGGCNQANVAETAYNAAHEGGLTAEAHPKVLMTLKGLKLEPRKLERDEDGTPTGLVWSTNDETGVDRRLIGANIYGGCYTSGYVNGDVVINLEESTVERDKVFADVKMDGDDYKTDADDNLIFLTENSGVILDEQGDDVFGDALNVYGGGYGKDSEIWGSTTLNLVAGYTFQLFGGGDSGAIGKKDSEGNYAYDAKYSTTINLAGLQPATEDNDVAEAEYIYGGGFKGLVAGNTRMNLGNGRIYDSFAGACNADVLGYTETVVGKDGFPWIRDNVYGGNDFGGRILGSTTHKGHNDADILSNTYVEYLQGRVDSVFCGNYGYYEYADREYEEFTNEDGSPKEGFCKPYIDSAFLHFKPIYNAGNSVGIIFGGSQGHPGEYTNNNSMQMSSYVLMEDPEPSDLYMATNIFGGGAFGGLGNTDYPGVGNAVIDLYSGGYHNVYGGCNKEGAVGFARVNVPETSTVHVNAIYGGGQGYSPTDFCDAYVSLVDYHGTNATVETALYGGNEDFRIARDTYINIDVPLKNRAGQYADIYGAGLGKKTIAGRTHVYMNSGAEAGNVYGGGSDGNTFNSASLTTWIKRQWADRADAEGKTGDAKTAAVTEGMTLYNDHSDLFATYLAANPTTVTLPAPLPSFVNDFTTNTASHNTNVYINSGALVAGNAYGGGLGENAVVGGTTNIQLLGGTVGGDLYGGGQGGSVLDEFALNTFTAGTNVNIHGGTVKNVYGGGLEGDVGYHDQSTTDLTDDVLGETHVIVGTLKADNHLDGSPTVERSIYGGGEKGAVFGTSNLTINNGYIGYKYDGGAYVANHDLQTADDNLLYENGNAFGGGFDEGGTVDFTNVIINGGVVRNGLYGGGEIAAIGRGEVHASGEQNSVREYIGTHKAGKTHVEMHGGHVERDLFGGGRGYSYNLRGSEISGREFYTDGYVFGQTEVAIHFGEIGTTEGLSKGYGNVFGGGNIGYVYGIGTAEQTPENETTSPGHYYYKDANGILTEDCKVVVSPSAYVLAGQSVTITYTPEGSDNSVTKTFTAGEEVPNAALNQLGDKSIDDRWEKLDLGGVNIHNAVFAGGNVSSGSDKIYANATTVFGNVTASLRDVFYRDLITIGTEHTGGLYGGGNLSLVSGYRELNITNYGTDYYNFENNKEITVEQYENELNDRERAYFQLLYKCIEDDGEYHVGDQISEESFEQKKEAGSINESRWEKAGFCTIYAGRLLNTIQRADFVAVFGSRMVLQGARDRVTTTVDYTDYTINRVGELSLNQEGDHGNYFGIYSVVNYLGNLTSDVWFNSERLYDESSYERNTTGETYEQFKQANINNRKRNNGMSKNKIALASGVYLELTTERSTGNTVDTKDWGYITGIVELDLINVVPGEGGGYVYAKNEHRSRTHDPEALNVTLSPYNKTARTYKRHSYSGEQNHDMETSGNFVHNVKAEPIIDDCYPTGGDHANKAHYWYIKGEIYVYDQTISAYTGSATAYAESTSIPLNVTAASNGRLKLINIQPNLYAYYGDDEQTGTIDDNGMLLNGKTYHLNDTITYWDYSLLSDSNKKRFVKETWVCIADGTVGGTSYTKGQVVLPIEIGSETVIKNKNGEDCELSDILRSSNNMSHSTGFLLTFDMNNPKVWNDWYSPILKAEGGKIDITAYGNLSDSDKERYIEGPTFKLDNYSVHGQRDYKVGDIIPAGVKADYDAIPESAMPSDEQATVARAYVAKEVVEYTLAGKHYHVEKGADISKDDYDLMDAATKAKFTEAFICTSTITISADLNKYVINATLLSQEEIDAYKAEYKKVTGASDTETNQLFSEHISEAYRITTAGKYGGKYYEEPKNYSAIESWCTLSDRDGFVYNKDALDILYDDNFGANFQADISEYGSPYNEVQKIDYTAYYTGVTDATEHNGITLTNGTEYSREDYEKLPNERYHYSPIVATAGSGTKNYYVVTESFYNGDMAYMAGRVISEDVYNRLKDRHGSSMTVIELTNNTAADVTYYYCREPYVIGERGDGVAVTTLDGSNYAVGETVPRGKRINQAQYDLINNYQQHFTIRGTEPTETSTLYVSRDSDIKSLSKDRTYTVIYQYTYDEGDDGGSHIEQISELHVVNIHVKFRSGVPTIGDLTAPPTILPGTTVGLTKPSVTEGAYEIMEGGWEMYRNSDDANLHRNGKSFVPSETEMYWYQNQKYYVAYYAKTYLGNTYSNIVPVSVANYHDLSEVMADKEHHMYIDQPDPLRNPKIYIDQSKHPDENQLDLLRDFYTLSTVSAEPLPTALAGHALLNTEQVGDSKNIDFILRSDLAPSGSWTPIGDDTHCFEATLHGDGYTVSGLDKSLFHSLCGEVYNLGVTGSFTSAGLVDTGTGYVENCWVKTSAPSVDDVMAVFGNPTKDSGTQVENCYYPESNQYSETVNARGNAIKATDRAFADGEVAYDLNGFYLKERYDRNLAAAGEDRHYNETYVSERRYGNEDFIYADGEIPLVADIRPRDAVTGKYTPLWKDDYLYFGQMLTYGHVPLIDYQPLPSHLAKNGEDSYKLFNPRESNRSNRVYRAPAYYRSKQIDVVHFSPYAVFATATRDGSMQLYPDMTAVDLSGYQDMANGRDRVSLPPLGRAGEGAVFFPPIFDEADLAGVMNADETPNLVVYSPADTEVEGDTHDVLKAYFEEPRYEEDTMGDGKYDYRRMAINSAVIKGHFVEQVSGADAGTFRAPSDQLLVDKKDFNAPFAYTLTDGTDGKRMWHQRIPDSYADFNKGWETVCLPFTVELVTTQDKGELSHFYGDAREGKIGHEYWLREYKAIASDDEAATMKATFSRPAADSEADDKLYTNTFLWDELHSQLADGQNQYYYQNLHTYEHYPLQQAATPYIIGFPGKSFYEFDLSGEWRSAKRPEGFERQVITFASIEGATIGVSDDEMDGVTIDGYTFKPNYLNENLEAGSNAYLMVEDGDKFAKVPAEGDATPLLPFRAYFVKGAAAPNSMSILFSDIEEKPDASTDGDAEPEITPAGTAVKGITFTSGAGTIIAKSTLDEPRMILVYNTGGALVKAFEVKPASTATIHVPSGMVYAVRTISGDYSKKMMIK